MSHHAKIRCLEYYGQPLTAEDQIDILSRLGRGEGAKIREWNARKDRLPIYLVGWRRIGCAIAVVVRTDMTKIVTVLPPDATEVHRRFEEMFGRHETLPDASNRAETEANG